MFSDRYEAHAIESQVQADWQSRDVYRVIEHNPSTLAASITPARCSPTPRGNFTWVMFVTTPSMM
jgi:hypothetical protein